jgi:hypothetical protein
VGLFAFLLPFAFLPTRLAAQRPESTCTPLIEAVDSVTRVNQLTGSWAQAARQSVDPSLADLVPPFAQMRRYELQFRRVDSYEAASAFRRILRRQSRLACAHYGLGRTLARGPDAFVRLGDGPRDYGPVPYSLAAANAPRELRRALELDSTLVEAATELLRLAADLRHEPVTRAAHEVDSLVAPALRDWPPLRIGEAQMVALEGHPDSAAAMIPDAARNRWTPAEREQAVEVLLDAGRPEAALAWLGPLTDGASSDRATYLTARALLDLPGREAEGAAAYMEGLAHADSAMLERYVEDIEPLIGEAINAWRAAAHGAVKDNVRWWWERSTALSGLTLGQRLSGHFRRLAEARRRYPRRSSLGAPPAEAVVRDPAWRRFRLDERGLTLVRQGEPERIITEDRLGVWSEAWIYPGRHGGNDIYYFTRPGCDGPFGSGAQCTTIDWLMVPLGCNVKRGVREELALFVPELYRSLTACETGGLAAAEFNRRALQAALDAWRTDGDRRHMDDRPDFAADFYALRGRTGTALTAVIGIDGSGLEAGGLASDPIYSSRTDLILVDSVRRTVERTGTTDRTRPGRALTSADVIREYVTTEVAPTPRTEYRIVVTDEVTGNARMAGGPLEIHDFRGDTLTLSGLVIASADSGTWRRGDVALTLLPGRVFTAGQPMPVYFEIYNQPADSAFTVEISLRAERRKGLLGRIAGLFGGERDENAIRYDDIASVTDPLFGIQQLRTLGTADLAPGEYTLTVTITDGTTGRSTSRSRAVTLREAPGG